ncbi:flagellar assembly protein FliW [Thermoanaerobacterium sp. DL9XJH110]|uniref:flagellar assembly protein FliW n=1 Tax=Thermoanaerobacterium sp. DL9XJH110 TaxID=3386643 RepID=UPI003BB4CBA4
MFINTRDFGRIEIDGGDVIKFPDGLPGFDELRKFILLAHPGNEKVKWLQSIENPDVSIPLVNPVELFPEYDPIISKENLKRLNLTSKREALILCVIAVPGDAGRPTVNLKAPVVINTLQRVADQVIVENENYQVRHPIPLKTRGE